MLQEATSSEWWRGSELGAPRLPWKQMQVLRLSYPLWIHPYLTGWWLGTLVVEPSEFSYLVLPHPVTKPQFSLSEDCGWNLTGQYCVGLEVQFWTQLGITETQKNWRQVIDFKFLWNCKMHLSFELHCLKNATIPVDVKVCVCVHMAPFPAPKALMWLTDFFPTRNNHHHGLN